MISYTGQCDEYARNIDNFLCNFGEYAQGIGRCAHDCGEHLYVVDEHDRVVDKYAHNIGRNIDVISKSASGNDECGCDSRKYAHVILNDMCVYGGVISNLAAYTRHVAEVIC